MTPAKYFYKRLRIEIGFQFKTIRTVADWSVQIYVGIPALIALIIWQMNMWHSEQVWLNHVSLSIFLVLLAFAISIGSLRLYIQEADVLFLRQQEEWFDAIVHRGMVFSFLRDCLIVTFWFAIAAPFLIRHYDLSWSAVIGMAFFGFIIKECMNYAMHLLLSSPRQLIRSLVYFLFVVCFVSAGKVFAFHLYQLIVINVLFTGVFLYFLKRRLSLQGTFINDVDHEQQSKWLLASLLFSQVIEQKSETVFSRNRPYLFKNSGIMFRKKTSVHRLADAYIKLFIRRISRLRFYFMLLGFAIAFVIVAPTWLKWGGWIAILLLITDWLRGHIKECADHSFLHLWHWQPETKRKAGEMAIRALLLPTAAITGGIMGGIVFSWIGSVVMVFLGFAIIFPIAHLLTP